MNAHAEAVYASRKVAGKSGREHALHSSIDREEGDFLEQIILDDPKISKTLEVGCAYGLSSLYICHAIKARPDPQHTIIDPFQYSGWDGVGVKNLKDSGIGFFKLIERRSEFGLPELLNAGEAAFDFIFIDGWHTFDHTLLDCFYATRLLRTGGYLVIDDANWPAVRRTADYLAFYPCYRIYATLGSATPDSAKRRIARSLLTFIPTSMRKLLFHPSFLFRANHQQDTRMIAFKKMAQDERDWKWFPPEF